jgi:hypothetical protein
LFTDGVYCGYVTSQELSSEREALLKQNLDAMNRKLKVQQRRLAVLQREATNVDEK